MRWAALLVFGGIGLGMFIAGCVWGYQSYVLSQVGVTIEGRVVEIEIRVSQDRDDRDYKKYYPVVEFLSADKKQHRFKADGSTSVGDYEVGAPVSVRYDPGNPANARIAGSKESWEGPLVLGLFGFVVLAGGIGAFFMSSDKTLRPEYHRTKDQEAQKTHSLGRTVIHLGGVVDSVRKQQGASGEEYVVVCRVTLPGGISQERFEASLAGALGGEVDAGGILRQRFEAAPIFFDPGPGILGKSVEIHVDPRDKTRFAVMLEPVLAELQSAKR